MSIFTQIWDWISGNILPILSSTTFLTVVGALLYWLKTHRAAAGNAQLIGELKDALKTNAAQASDNAALKTAVADLAAKIETYEAKGADLQERLVSKTDYLFDTLRAAYNGQLKNADTLTVVNNLIDRGKLLTPNVRDKAAESLDGIKADINVLVDKVNRKVDSSKAELGKTLSDAPAKRGVAL